MHGFLLGEIPLDVDDADWQETCFVEESVVGAFVDVDGSVGSKAV